MKKFLSIILALVLCFGTMSVMGVSAGAADVADKTLKFKGDGEFKIMQLADLQDTSYATPATYDYIRALVAEEDPDLIVLTGDNISAGTGDALTEDVARWQVKKAIDNTMSVFEELNIPVAVVFGNHDGEALISKEEQMAMYQTYGCCVGFDEGDSLYGCGTYNLPIYSSDGEKIAYNLWMFDSNMYDDVNGGYDYVHEDQIDWYVNKSNELKAQNGGKVVPSMVFQHIIVNEIYDALAEVPAGSDNAIQYGDKWLGLPAGVDGFLRENPCPGTQDSLQFEKMVEQGDVKAMFFGHDHVNSFVVPYQGIDIVNTPTSGFGSYGNKESRGVRIITINEKDTSKYETKVINYFEKFAVDNASECRYLMSEGDVWNAIRYLFLSSELGIPFYKAFYEILCLIF
ncbi:MAG: metallophosphoesterase family protein [Clostridia bacterium]|nr:metallophosphoesterase family protein [Clostridia bacterium]